ncbi:uncharacterized protein LOC119671675 [Teleopsis dalmanni]|uniref:uncharacterized protein LOC119671675 n=1 Tax=Teleopsis dalmanni TaxID=139649 RepID=UPI000D32B9D2|nr:uncharacterized protein LOC119671675 [Teleopsis dalmanni]
MEHAISKKLQHELTVLHAINFALIIILTLLMLLHLCQLLNIIRPFNRKRAAVKQSLKGSRQNAKLQITLPPETTEISMIREKDEIALLVRTSDGYEYIFSGIKPITDSTCVIGAELSNTTPTTTNSTYPIGDNDHEDAVSIHEENCDEYSNDTIEEVEVDFAGNNENIDDYQIEELSDICESSHIFLEPIHSCGHEQDA